MGKSATARGVFRPLIDSYCHLDMECESPIADIEKRMLAADVARALLVETWDGRNRPVLKSVLRSGKQGKFSVAFCYCKERPGELRELMRAGDLRAVRMKTEDLARDYDFCRDVCRSGTILITHAEAGIGALCKELTDLCGRISDLQIYIPHLGWPMKNGKEDSEWEAAIPGLLAIPATVFGISAISHFSNQPFPHSDVREVASRLIFRLPPGRVTIGSDYPLFEKERYGDYMSLARDWVTSIHPDWSCAYEGSRFHHDR